MFVGHGMLAFAIVAFGASRAFDVSDRRALALGGAAFAFATLPDIDVLFTLDAAVETLVGDAGSMEYGAFDGSVHRTVTHSVVLAPMFAAIAYLGAVTSDDRRVALLALLVTAPLAAIGLATHGVLGGLIMAAFLLGLVVTGWAAAEFGNLSGLSIGLAAFVGLVTHPIGDVFTGGPPAMLYPLSPSVIEARVAVLSDPTLNLLLVMGIELATLWAALYVLLELTERTFRGQFRSLRPLPTTPAYAGAVFVVPLPTVSEPHAFVYSLLAFSLVVAALSVRRTLLAVSTGVLTGFTVGSAVYAVVYTLVYTSAYISI